MADGAEQRTTRYSAFISYSHRDADFARRLHRRLENYRLPRRLFRRGEAISPDSRRLKPLFRDREELAAAADLPEAVRTALAESSHLIVVCSPNAASSEWVGREVQVFRSLHGDAGILTALYRGTPATAFHPALLLAGSGGLPLQPLAADFQHHGDGFRLALLKLVAALADVKLDALVQRDAQRHVRQVTGAAVAALAVAALTGLLSVIAFNARAAAERERTRGEGVIEFMLTDLRGRLKGVGRLDVLNAVNQGALRYYQGQDLAHLPSPALEQRARLLQAIGEDDEKRGDVAGARAQFDEALRTTTELLKARPDDPARIFAHAQSEYWVGFISWRTGDDAGAEAGFKAYAALAARLALIDPRNPDWLLETGYADSNLGMFALRQSVDTARAGALFGASLAHLQAAAALRPGDRDIPFQVADGYAWLADVDRLSGNYVGALRNRTTQLRMLNALLASDPRDFQTRTQLVGATLALGRIDAARGAYASAIAQLKQAHDIARALARADPENAGVARQVRIIELFEARTWMMTPRRERPQPGVLAAALGDCTADAAMPHNEELAEFCTILRARWLADRGDRRAAARLLAPVRAAVAADHTKLTETWRLNLNEELRQAL